MTWDFGAVFQFSEALWNAFLVTLELTAFSIVIGTILGLIFGFAMLSRGKIVRFTARVYVETFLALPVLVLIIWLYYVLPHISIQLSFSGFWVSVAGLSLSLSAFIAEIIRAGLGGVPMGESEVAYCVGLKRRQVIRYILVPQAFRRMWPAIMGQYITCYKFSTLASVVAVQELLHVGGNIIVQTYRPIEIYSAIAFIFIVTVIPLNVLLRDIHNPAAYKGTRRI